MTEREKTTREMDADETVEEREAVADGLGRQDHEARKDAAESRTTFDDDTVTPRLNDGR